MNILDFVKHFEIKKISKNSYQALCPAHDDKQASLTISYDNKNEVILLHCHAGCNTTDILNSVI